MFHDVKGEAQNGNDIEQIEEILLYVMPKGEAVGREASRRPLSIEDFGLGGDL